MDKLKLIIFVAFCMFVMRSVGATSVVVDRITVTKENAKDLGISINIVKSDIYCTTDLEVWITSPKKAKRGIFSFAYDRRKEIIGGDLYIRTTLAEPIFSHGATYTNGKTDQQLKKWQALYGFRANGFKGVLVCIQKEQLDYLSISFDDRYPNDLITRVWNLGNINKWK